MVQRLRQRLIAIGRLRQALLILVLAGTILNAWTAIEALSHVSSGFVYASGNSPGDVFTPPDDPGFLVSLAAALKHKEDQLDQRDTILRSITDRCAAQYPAYGEGPAATAQRTCVETDPRYKAARAAADAATVAGIQYLRAESAADAAQSKYDSWRGERAHYDSARGQVGEQTSKVEFGILVGGLILWLVLPRVNARTES